MADFDPWLGSAGTAVAPLSGSVAPGLPGPVTNEGGGSGPLGPGQPASPGGTPVPAPPPPPPYFDAFSGTWVQPQPDGSVVPYRAPQTAGAGAGNLPGLIFRDDGRGGGQYVHQDGSPATQAEVTQAITVSRNSTSSSTSSSTSDIGPNALANDAANRAQLKAQQDAASQQAIATLNEQIRAHNQDYQNAQATLAFNQQKEAFAETTQNTQLQRQAQQDVFANTMSINTLNLQRATLVSNRDSLQAQLQMQAATQNAQNALAANQQNQQAEESRQANLLKTNEDVANFAGNPTDYGKLAAFQLANRGWGQAANASGGANLTSDESLQPLAGALSLRDTLQKPITPYVPQQVVAPTLGALDLSSIVNPQIPGTQMQSAGASAVGQPAPGGSNFTTLAQQAAAGGMGTQGVSQIANAGLTGNANAVYHAAFGPNGTFNTGAAPAMKDGGLAQGAYISGEEGEELNIPLGAGQALVLNKKQLAKMKPGDIKKLKAMADGGVFNGGNVLNLQDTSQATNFLGDAYQKGLSSAGIGNVPTPVYASSPGFSPFVTQLYGGLGALAGRGPADWYTQQASDLAPGAYRPIPYGVASRPVTRTA